MHSGARARLTRNLTLYLFALPAIVLTFVFSYLPMAGVTMAFQDFNILKGFLGSPFAGLRHFVEFLRNPEFYAALRNTVCINLLVLVVGFPLPIVFALLINEMRDGAYKRVTQTITYLPHFISWVVLAGLIYRLADYDSGSITALFGAVTGTKPPLLREPRYFWTILVFASIWKELGWNSILFLAALAGVEVELYEAASMDGAGRLRRMLHISIPAMLPVIMLLLILNVGTLFVSGAGITGTGGAGLDATFNLQNPNVMSAAKTLELYVFMEGVRWSHYSYAAAIGVAQSVVALLMVLGSNTLSRKVRGYGAF
jgi:putative aldouronate transport system permease protein